METNMQNQQTEENQVPFSQDGNSGDQVADGNLNGNKEKKKYHSSALYAASLWHGTVQHVKPTHPQIER